MNKKNGATIRVFDMKVQKEEAEEIAKIKGSWVWRIIFANKKFSEVRLHYVEYKILTFNALHKPNYIDRLVYKQKDIQKQKIQILCNGSSGAVAMIDSLPQISEMTIVDANIVQYSDQIDDDFVKKGRKLGTRILHRFVGGLPELEYVGIESVFRPYWIAMYGDVVEGAKVRYMPIAADGCNSQRSF